MFRLNPGKSLKEKNEEVDSMAERKGGESKREKVLHIVLKRGLFMATRHVRILCREKKEYGVGYERRIVSSEHRRGDDA